MFDKDIISTLSIALGAFLALNILSSNKGILRNRLAKVILLLIVILNIHLQFDYILLGDRPLEQVAREGLPAFAGYSYYLYHLNGALFFLFVIVVFEQRVRLRPYAWAIIFISILRIAYISINYPHGFHMGIPDSERGFLYLTLEACLSSALNILFYCLSWLQLRKVHFALTLGPSERMNYQWLRRIAFIAIIIYFGMMTNMIVYFLWRPDMEIPNFIERILLSLFTYVMVWLAVRFPIFSLYGDYDNRIREREKYQNSSLGKADADALWERINDALKSNKGYSAPEFRLNDLAEEMNETVHRISQAINEQGNQNFTELINGYRIEDAKRLLVSPRFESLTILGIAFEVGFNSKSAFYNAFKKEMGTTPLTYRNSMLK